MYNIPQKNNLQNKTKRAIIEWLIKEGLPSGSRLPSKREFARKYKVSEITTGNALNELAYSGIVRQVPRQGTFLLSPPKRPLLADVYFPKAWENEFVNYNISHHSYYLYRQYLDGIIHGAAECNVSLTIEYLSSFDDDALRNARQTLTRDGAVYMLYGSGEFFSELQKTGLPYVHVLPQKAKVKNEIGVSFTKALNEAVKNFKDKGFQRFSVLTFKRYSNEDEDSSTVDIFEALSENNVTVEEQFIYRYSWFSEEKKIPPIPVTFGVVSWRITFFVSSSIISVFSF